MNDASIEMAVAVRRLLRCSERVTLATSFVENSWPYASLVMVTCAQDASPLFLFSVLAEHTRNLALDSRASLLFDGTTGHDVPLAEMRVTVLGLVERCDQSAMIDRYILRHADTQAYLALGDFHLYRMTIERVHVVVGFGAIQWLSADQVVLDVGFHGELAAAEADLVDHMNKDHSNSLTFYATGLLGHTGKAGL